MDKQQFTQAVKASERTLYRVARSYLATDADAADAVQEALTRAWMKRDTLREPAYFRTWLIRILINECKSALRSRRRVEPMAEVPEPPPPEPPADYGVKEALRAMDAKYRAPLVLFYLEGYTIQEVAGMLTLPQGTVKNRLFRGKAQLRRLLGEEVFEDEER